MQLLKLDEAFRLALCSCIDSKGRGGQSALARYLGVTPQYIDKLRNGNVGSEMHRRQIAEFFGYTSYDVFLEFGYSLLAGETAEPTAPPLSSVKLKVIEKIKLLDDSQVMALEPIIQALGQAGAGADNQAGRVKVKPGKRTMVVDEVEEIGVIELPGEPVKNNKK